MLSCVQQHHDQIRQHNGQKKEDKWTNNDLQNTTQKTSDQATRTPLRSSEGQFQFNM
jgi:hypothetical protein